MKFSDNTKIKKSKFSLHIHFKKNGLKKIGFHRLARIYVCMGYKSTNKMFETFAKDFDIKLLSWKEHVEKDVKREREILSKLSESDPNNEEEVRLEGDKLAKHRESMHPK